MVNVVVAIRSYHGSVMGNTSHGIPTSSDHPNLIQFGYPPGNSHIPPWEVRKITIQNAIFWGIWVFPKIGVPQKHPKMIIFSRKTHGCWVPPFRKPLCVTSLEGNNMWTCMSDVLSIHSSKRTKPRLPRLWDILSGGVM